MFSRLSVRRPAAPAAVKRLAHLVKRLADLVRHTRSIRRPRAGGLVAVGDSITTGTGEPRFGLLADDSWVTYVVGKGKVRYGFNAAVSGQSLTGFCLRALAIGTSRCLLVKPTAFV